MKFKELETDKESLKLQVSILYLFWQHLNMYIVCIIICCQVVVLSDQVDSQCEKIGDLEKLLDDKKEVLKRTEDILQREMINRSALETKKLELMSDIAQLKLREAAIEKENMELRKKLSKTMHQIQHQPQSHFGTLPKTCKVPLETHFNIVDQKAETAKLNGSHCGSAPNLASKEDQKTKAKGLRKFLGKMKRSSSGHFHEDSKKSHQSLDRTSLRRPTPSYSRGSEGSRFSDSGSYPYPLISCDVINSSDFGLNIHGYFRKVVLESSKLKNKFVINGTNLHESMTLFATFFLESKEQETLSNAVLSVTYKGSTIILELRRQEDSVKILFSTQEFKQFLLTFFHCCTRILYFNPKYCNLVKEVLRQMCKATNNKEDALKLLKSLSGKAVGKIKTLKGYLKDCDYATESDLYELLHIFPMDYGTLSTYMDLGSALNQLNSSHWHRQKIKQEGAADAEWNAVVSNVCSNTAFIETKPTPPSIPPAPYETPIPNITRPYVSICVHSWLHRCVYLFVYIFTI